MQTPIFDVLEYSYQKLDSQVADLQAEYRDRMQCRRGCAGCCMDGFKIRYVEAMQLLKGFIEVSPEVAQAILDRLNDDSAEGKSKCPLLVNDACMLYQHRPSLCRAYGLMLQLKENVSTCTLNFKDLPPGQSMKVLDIAPYYVLLDELSERLWADAPNSKLSTAEEPPNWSIRTFLSAFLNPSQESEDQITQLHQ